MSIKINSFMVWVIVSVFYSICDLSINTMCSGCEDIGYAYAFAAFVPASLYLMGSYRTAPQEIIRKFIHMPPLSA